MAFYDVDQQTGNFKDKLAGSFEDIIYSDAPVGAIVPFGGDSAPTAWLLCNGAAVSRTTYADLFAVIGTKYGSGDGSTTFNLPSAEAGAALYPVSDGDGLEKSVYIIKAVKTALPTEFEQALATKQNITDNSLQTTNKTVPGAINELKNFLSVEKINITKDETYCTFNGKCDCYKVGNIVFLDLGFALSANATGIYTNYKIASGLPAVSNSYMFGGISVDGLSDECSFSIYSNGDLRIDVRGTPLAEKQIYAHFCPYIII